MCQEREVLSSGFPRDAEFRLTPSAGDLPALDRESDHLLLRFVELHLDGGGDKWRRSLTEGAGVGRIRGAAGAAVTVSPLRSSGNHCGYPGLDSFGQVVPRGGELGQIGRHSGRVWGAFGVFGGALKGR